MGADPGFWLGAIGAATGCIGMVTGIVAAIYARRQAVAAEGPKSPDVEMSSAQWDTENPGWLRIRLITRNRTSETWVLERAALLKPKRSVIISEQERPIRNGGKYFSPTKIPLIELDQGLFLDKTNVNQTAIPEASHPWDGRKGDTMYTTLYIKPRDQTTQTITLVLNFRSKAAVVKVQKIVVKRELPPMVSPLQAPSLKS